MTRKPHRQFPTESEWLLIEAACADKDRALSAWRSWLEERSLDEVARSEYELLPSVYANLSQSWSEFAERGTLKGIARRTWYENKLLFAGAGALLRGLASAGIPAALLKGAAMITQDVYQPAGRPMHDIDVLVPSENAAAAVDAAARAGWHAVLPLGAPPDRLARFVHSLPFTDGKGGGVDLHWHVLMDACDSDSDAPLWQEAIAVRASGVDLFALCPTDLLFHLCIHGSKWSPARSVRWLVDARRVLDRFSGRIDWTRLVWLAERGNHTLALSEALRGVDALGPGVVDARCLEGLLLRRPGSLERLDRRAQNSGDTVLGSSWRDLTRYLRLSSKRRLSDRALGASTYVRSAWSISPRLGLGRWALGRFASRLGRFTGLVRGGLRRSPAANSSGDLQSPL